MLLHPFVIILIILLTFFLFLVKSSKCVVLQTLLLSFVSDMGNLLGLHVIFLTIK